MEEVYSVSTNNRFALFMDDEDDPGDTILQSSKVPDKSEKKTEQKKNEKGGKVKPKDVRDKSQVMQNGRKVATETTNKRSQREPPTGAWCACMLPV